MKAARLHIQSGHTETICYLSAFGGKADIGRCIAPIISESSLDDIACSSSLLPLASFPRW